MNKEFIRLELHKRGITKFGFITYPAGTAISIILPENPPRFLNSFLPIDDESDMRFCDFVEFHYRKYYPR